MARPSIPPPEQTLRPAHRAGFALTYRFMLLALRLLRRNRRRSMLTLSSLIFSQVIMILSFSLTEAATRMQVDQVCRKSSGHLQIQAPGFAKNPDLGAYLTDTVPLERLQQLDGRVVGTRARATLTGMVGLDERRQFVVFRGLDPKAEPGPRVTAGQKLSPAPRQLPVPEILLGRQLAADLKAEPGALVLVTYIRPGGHLDDIQCRVRGLTDEGSPEADRRMATLPLLTIQRLLGLGEGCHQELVFVADPDQVEAVARRLREGLGPKYAVLPWSAFNPQLRRITHLTRATMVLMVGIIVLISLFGIAGVLAMSVAERAREFGLFAAMGMYPAEMLQCVLLEAFILGTVTLALASGTAFVILKLLEVHGFNFTFLVGEAVVLDGVQLEMILYPRVQLVHFLAAAVLVWGTSLLAALWPALRAARQDPLEAMAGVP
jgi:putative ABC transport system permease protein